MANIPTGTSLASNVDGIKNRDFRLTSRFISEMIQDRAIATMQYEWGLALVKGVISNDLE